MLSFSDELEENGDENVAFSIGESTKKR